MNVSSNARPGAVPASGRAHHLGRTPEGGVHMSKSAVRQLLLVAAATLSITVALAAPAVAGIGTSPS